MTMGFFSSVLSDLLAGTAVNGGLSGITGGLSDVGAGLIAFFGTITDGQMWRSIGWLVLGVLLLGTGLALWVKGEAVSTVRSAAGL
jgi:hypothetical protein